MVTQQFILLWNMCLGIVLPHIATPIIMYNPLSSKRSGNQADQCSCSRSKRWKGKEKVTSADEGRYNELHLPPLISGDPPSSSSTYTASSTHSVSTLATAPSQDSSSASSSSSPTTTASSSSSTPSARHFCHQADCGKHFSTRSNFLRHHKEKHPRVPTPSASASSSQVPPTPTPSSSSSSSSSSASSSSSSSISCPPLPPLVRHDSFNMDEFLDSLSPILPEASPPLPPLDFDACLEQMASHLPNKASAAEDEATAIMEEINMLKQVLRSMQLPPSPRKQRIKARLHELYGMYHSCVRGM